MKKLLLCIVLCFCSISVYSQENFLTDFIEGVIPSEKIEKSTFNKFKTNLELVGAPNNSMVFNRYVELSRITTLAERKTNFRTYDSQLKADLWKIHFAYCLTKYNFTTEQRELIIFVASKTEAKAYENQLPLFDENFTELVKSQFNPEYFRLVFGILGDGGVLKPDDNGCVKVTTQVDDSIPRPDCNCRSYFGCGSGLTCDQGNANCQTNQNCGFIFSDTCTGRCIPE